MRCEEYARLGKTCPRCKAKNERLEAERGIAGMNRCELWHLVAARSLESRS